MNNTNMDFRYRPRDGGAVRAMLWLNDATDETPLRTYASTHDMQVAGVCQGDVPQVLRAAEAGDINLVLAWRVERLGDHSLCGSLGELRSLGVEFMSVLEL